MYEETIRSFLARPLPIAVGTWSSASVIGVSVFSLSPLQAYLNFNAAVIGKLAGFSLLRTDLELTLRINGTRFHHGALVLAWYPFLSASNTLSRDTAYGATMQPSTIVTPFADNVDPLIVPWVWPYHFMDITAPGNQTNFGAVRVKVLAPLAAVGQTTVVTLPVTLYCRLVNPVLTGFTSGTQAVTAASDIVQQSLVGDSGMRMVAENLNPYRAYGDDISMCASVKKVEVPTSDGEHGFSDLHNTYAHMLKVRSFMNLKPWSTADLQGSNLMTVPVRPDHGLSLTNIAVRNYLGTVMQAHQFWRGSIGFHLKIFASGFHSGRLAITWDPVIQSMTTTANTINNANRIILDLQQESEIYFKVPYAFYKPWSTVAESLPTLSFAVQNPLATANGLSSTVYMILFAYGLDSLKFAMPFSTVTFPIQSTADPDVDIQEQCYFATSDMFKSISAAGDMFPNASMPEECLSIKDTCRRMAPVSGPGTTTFNGVTTSTHFFNPWFLGTSANTPFNMFMAMFAVSRGSIRYGATEDQHTYAAAEVPMVLDNDYSVGVTMSSLFTVATSTGATFFSSARVIHNSAPSSVMVVPFYSQAKFYVHRRLGTVFSADLMPFYTLSRANANGTASYSLFASPGTDFVYGMQISPLQATNIANGA